MLLFIFGCCCLASWIYVDAGDDCGKLVELELDCNKLRVTVCYGFDNFVFDAESE